MSSWADFLRDNGGFKVWNNGRENCTITMDKDASTKAAGKDYDVDARAPVVRTQWLLCPVLCASRLRGKQFLLIRLFV